MTMNEKTPYVKDSAEKTVRDIRRRTRRKFSAEEKIRIVLEGLCGEESIAELFIERAAKDLHQARAADPDMFDIQVDAGSR